MFALEAPLEPRTNEWLDVRKPELIKASIEEICENIIRKGDRSRFPEIFDYIYLYVEDNIEKFLPEHDFWD